MNMSGGNIHGLSWFPNIPDKFVTWGGQEIKLYVVGRNKVESEASARLPNIPANLEAIENHYEYARCVQPSFHKNRPIIAVGLGNGKVGISDFHGVMEKDPEYTPRQQRMCLCLAWSENNPNMLAIGHDRHRSDSCITIWDTERGPPKESESSFFGVSESAHSLCWDKNHQILIAGMNQKQIKLYDLRQSTTTCQSIQTKTVYGLGVAPNGNYLCSFFDSVIMLWDLRAIDRPLLQIQSAKNHLHLSWCPTRSSLLSSLQRESPYITLYDIRCVDVEKSREVYHVKKQLLPFHTKHHASHKGYTLAALSWHHMDFERALLLSETGSIMDFHLPLSILTAYSNHKKLPLLLQKPLSAPNTPVHSSQTSQTSSSELSNAKSPLNFDVVDKDLQEEDLVEWTRERALCDYGLKMAGKRLNGEFHLTSYLKTVWLSLANVYRSEEKLIGLKTVLGIGLSHTSEAFMNTSRIESHVLQWPDFINNACNLVCYRSDQRDTALKLCGWPSEQELDRFVNTLCENKEFSRAAMIYVFHLKVLAACDILSKAVDQSRDPSMFRIAAIALSCFNADRTSTAWRNQRSLANKQIKDPHLRAIFSFLVADNDNFDSVLAEEKEGISLADRMAFACKYLSESKLAEYVKLQIQRSVEKGDLNGLLLTGESQEGINILQSYMDSTFDIQTVALIAINYFHRELFNDFRIQYWITSYMDCLNSWGFWEKRAELEIKIANLRSSIRSPRTVYLSCNFCGKSVSNALQEDARMRNVSSNVNKLSSCPSCRKPLPRCSLCLLHMGTTLNAYTAGEGGNESQGVPSKPFSKWFSWCQTCRHGGHTEHLMQWFKQNAECPVSSCSCRCFDMDVTNPIASTDLS
ncbi:GATOR complex protein MIOS [Musca domestica]|uniref:WD repeat-containing protein mio n=1 Tax=Musca domestica TaxID=7370 RepID=A0A1I8MUN1_MUSDO|nr:GATOR complex protein MIOS [Musca domestica]